MMTTLASAAHNGDLVKIKKPAHHAFPPRVRVFTIQTLLDVLYMYIYMYPCRLGATKITTPVEDTCRHQ